MNTQIVIELIEEQEREINVLKEAFNFGNYLKGKLENDDTLAISTLVAISQRIDEIDTLIETHKMIVGKLKELLND